MANANTLQEIAPGCFRLRAPFHILHFIDIGTHMHFVKLSSGRFVALSAVVLDADAKKAVDKLTENGSLLDAVVATNPFHTLAFESFHKAYPSPKYYSTPRHARLYPDIPWSGSITDPKTLTQWSPDLDLQIPAGCEFDAPVPESINHFTGVIALHRASKTLICDDAFSAAQNPGLIQKTLLGAKHGQIMFHMSLLPHAIDKTPAAPKQFYDWVLALVRDWDFDNLSSAHGGVMIGGAKTALVECLERSKKSLSDLAVKNGGSSF
ncbi:hypothetical protein HDU98_006655 [Podochytrium sp. JEL0797]|nr:hypothetical protein HDU98_006655 [Podochytrium sp. JEL0797]